MEELDCDKDTAFESFIIKHHSMFNNEVDMYGDIQQVGDSQLKVGNFEDRVKKSVRSQHSTS